ncbi:dihydroorotate dehydrogenase B (NAD(+)), electron transfer subunit [Halobacillus andaensis]|uniref:Dihydroorotate dehydrogenase B (NAD(+)), electron transfer subunit n=1 Tax=Halobacillus andaensis TaxID=1176239 RepID=A0A917AZY3_HALAA|nr:dihydroorotate dehydrogenase electron transfer subunit [Halobacillus andaensis]MBP2003556.1 dihydroorotate dehydrogenase electron transfer subunit [Halobacillus andaensis]GGF11524.1 dihydroorotate dehydrogenase B (NAD(+)), electron transfer subunit [Halobacillus andaensis]
MIREWMKVVNHQQIAFQTYLLELQGEISTLVERPGQFVHVQVSDQFFLRRPVSIADVSPVKGTITLLYKVMGEGTEALTKKAVGDKVDIVGPGGNGFPVEQEKGEEALLIGGGIGIPPLYYLGKQLVANGINVKSVLGYRSKAELFYVEEFNALGEVQITTNDGSVGEKGFVTDALPHLESIDAYYTCGPSIMLKNVKEKLDGVPGYISIEERMGCGIGACFACVLETSESCDKGYVRVCSDGPVFRPGEVIL